MPTIGTPIVNSSQNSLLLRVLARPMIDKPREHSPEPSAISTPNTIINPEKNTAGVIRLRPSDILV